MWYACRGIQVECVQTNNGFEFTKHFSNSKQYLPIFCEKTAPVIHFSGSRSSPSNLRFMTVVSIFFPCDLCIGFLSPASLSSSISILHFLIQELFTNVKTFLISYNINKDGCCLSATKICTQLSRLPVEFAEII